MRINKESKDSEVGRFTVITTNFIYEPEMDGEFSNFIALVNACFDKPPGLNRILGGVQVVEIIEGVKPSAKNKVKR